MNTNTPISALMFLILAGIGHYLHPNACMMFIAGAIASFILSDNIKYNFTHSTPYLLPMAIVGMGATLNLAMFSTLSVSTLLLLAGSVIGVISLGFSIAKLCHLKGHLPLLLTMGTAICGATAIMTIAPILNPKKKDLLHALSTLFILNGLALYLFPMAGHLFNLTETQFGTWAAIAIHDTSSVIGSTLNYGTQAVQTALLLKLCRATAIIPISLFLLKQSQPNSKHSPKFTLAYIFIGLFIMSGLSTLTPHLMPLWSGVSSLSKTCLLIVIFSMGLHANELSLNRTLKHSFLFGILLWTLTSGLSLSLILHLV